MTKDPEVILPDPPETVESLRAQLKEKERLLAEKDKQLKTLQGLRIWAIKIFLGSDLTQASRDFFNTTEPNKPLPRDETANLFAAVVHRVLYVGVIGVLLAVIPGAVSSGLLWKQNQLVEFQNEAIQEQNEKIQIQLTKQAQAVANQESDTQTVRRTQLLTLIYEESDCDLQALIGDMQDEEKKRTKCPPKAPLRLRQEATIALARIDKESLYLPGVELKEADFSGRDLSRANLMSANLSDTHLIKTNLSDAILWNTNFSGANLIAADLSGAELRKANLSGANLWSADLSRANLSGANLRDSRLTAIKFSAFLFEADFSGSNLSGSDLSGARGLTQSQVNEAQGSEKTILPKGLSVPDHWKNKP